MRRQKHTHLDTQYIHTKAFLFTLKALCADKPLSNGGFLRIKLVARLRLGVGAVTGLSSVVVGVMPALFSSCYIII